MSKSYYEIWDLERNRFTYNEEIKKIEIPSPNMVACYDRYGCVIALWPVNQIFSINLVEIPEKGVDSDEAE